VTDVLDGRIGEAWAGERPNGCHVNLVVGRRGSATAAAATLALASPRPAHVPFLAALQDGRMIHPPTIVVNKTPIENDRVAKLTWGAVQVGVAQGVLDAVHEGVLAVEEAEELVLLVAVWIDAAAEEETAVRRASRTAMRAAVADALAPPSGEEIRAVAARREEPRSAYYGGE
jgi:5,6,7,8-tetrahydromethanopterin hydro-lyase